MLKPSGVSLIYFLCSLTTNHSRLKKNLSFSPVNKTLGDPGSGTKSYRSGKKSYLPQTALDATQGDVN